MNLHQLEKLIALLSPLGHDVYKIISLARCEEPKNLQ